MRLRPIFRATILSFAALLLVMGSARSGFARDSDSILAHKLWEAVSKKDGPYLDERERKWLAGERGPHADPEPFVAADFREFAKEIPEGNDLVLRLKPWHYYADDNDRTNIVVHSGPDMAQAIADALNRDQKNHDAKRRKLEEKVRKGKATGFEQREVENRMYRSLYEIESAKLTPAKNSGWRCFINSITRWAR